jgi:type I restriction enzyme S subunit
VTTLVPLKRVVDPDRPITYGIVQAGPDVGDGVPYIRPVDMSDHGGVADLRELRTTSPEIAAQYSRSSVRRGDIIVSIGPSYGKTMVVPAELDGANLTQGTARVAPARGVDAGYLRWALRSMLATAHWDAAIGGATFRALNLGPLAETPIPFRPLTEQRAIADYLDAETARIDALITKKKQLIFLLEERWAATLTEAFSHPSGLRLKHLLAAPMAYGVLVPDHVADGPMMLRINDFRNGEPDPALVARISEALHHQYRRTIVSEGDLVVSVVGTLGRAAVVSRQLAGANLNRPLARLQLLPEAPADLVRMWCESTSFAHQAERATGSDSAQPTLNLGDLKNFTLGLPSSPSAWWSLYRDLQLAEAWRKRARTVVARQIGVLSERRRALITSAVTGELDLPDSTSTIAIKPARRAASANKRLASWPVLGV